MAQQRHKRSATMVARKDAMIAFFHGFLAAASRNARDRAPVSKTILDVVSRVFDVARVFGPLRPMRPRAATAALLGALVIAGCAQKSDDGAAMRQVIGDGVNAIGPFGSDGRQISVRQSPEPIKLIGFAAIPGWANDDHAAALRSFQLSCRRILGLRNTEVLGNLAGDLADWRPVCQSALALNPAQARAFFERNFTPGVIAPDQTALLTAYYEPELLARRRPDQIFKFPLHRKPPELQRQSGEWGRVRNGRFEPYYTRNEVYRGALNGRGLELAYLADPIDAFFLQVQGSGRLRLGDGSVMRLGFAAKNGHPYNSVGRELMRRGWSASGSKDAIEAFVRANPGPGFELLSHNQSYIFFREVTDLNPAGGPEGALGVQLSDLRSIAVDRRYTPLGAPVWIEGDTAAGPVRQLMVAQDTGSAIIGPQRADLFWGSGQRAGQLAGRTKSPGRLITLFPNAVASRLLANAS